ncbi:MAG: PQQ-dependent sugar dehydrogenase [Ignavibacteria bacterium]
MKKKFLPRIFVMYRRTNIFISFAFLFIFLNILTVKAQYKLVPAFPNLLAFNNPVEIVHPGDSTNRLFVAQQNGIIYVFDNSQAVTFRKQFINLSSLVSTRFQAGLLGLAFHPDFEHNHYFYVHYVMDSAGSGFGQYIRISRFTASFTEPDTAYMNTEQILFTISLPDRYHNGGQVEFGPDHYLYIAIGDAYFNDGIKAQDRTELLGKILRINVDSASGGRNYSIPVTNPFYNNTDGWRQEIYAYGFRNPWRFSIDHQTNTLWLGDAGQFLFEEIDLVKNGKNYGWNKMEGFHCYPDTTLCDTTGKGFTMPVWEYRHTHQTPSGNAVVCGPLYRGSLIPELYGKVIYGDYGDGSISALSYDGVNPTTSQLLVDTNFNIASFGEDQYKELYVCRLSATEGGIYRLCNTNIITLNLKVIVEGFYNVNANALNIRDTVSVYLHSAILPFQIVDSARCVIDSLTFNGLCFFNNAPDGTYYITVKHRNALETWSEEGGETFVRGSINSYDFTNVITKSFQSSAKLKGTKYCLISGDCNQNGVINAVDRATVIGQLGSAGYLVSDLDGNGVVNAVDRAIIVSNLGRSKISP